MHCFSLRFGTKTLRGNCSTHIFQQNCLKTNHAPDRKKLYCTCGVVQSFSGGYSLVRLFAGFCARVCVPQAIKDWRRARRRVFVSVGAPDKMRERERERQRERERESEREMQSPPLSTLCLFLHLPPLPDDKQ